MYFIMIERKKKFTKTKYFATSVHRDINPKIS